MHDDGHEVPFIIYMKAYLSIGHVSQQWERLKLVLPSNFPVGVHRRLAAQLY
jgi:hypothetical protein